MKKIIFVTISLLFLISCQKKGEKITITGSTTIEPILIHLSKEFKKKNDVIFSFKATGSKSGINSLISGKSYIADSSVKIGKDELKLAESKGIKIKEFLIAKDLIVPIVNKNNPVNNISISQMKDLFSGKILYWKKSGNNKINIYARDSNSGTGEVWKDIVMKGEKISSNATLLPSNSSVLHRISSDTGGLGYISYSFVNSDVKIIDVEGITPSIASAKNNKYPVVRDLYIYVNENELKGSIKSFIVFILSKDGRKIIEEEKFIPTTK